MKPASRHGRCGQITRNPGGAVFAAKRAVIDGLRLPGDDGLRPEAHLFRGVNPSSDARAANVLWPNED